MFMMLAINVGKSLKASMVPRSSYSLQRPGGLSGER